MICMQAFVNGACRWQKSEKRCVQATNDANRAHPTFVDGCVQATEANGRKNITFADGYVQDMMLLDLVQRRQTNMCWLRTMVAAHVRHRLTVVCKTKAIRVDNTRRRMTNA